MLLCWRPRDNLAPNMGYCDERLKTTTSRYSGFTNRLRAWLSPASEPRSADLIFVLAGGMHRKDYALELFRQGLAPGILFSVGRFEIRRFSKMPLPAPLDLLKIAQELPPPRRHYFTYFHGQEVIVEHVPPGKFGTLTEIEALASWLCTNPDIRSILVISSDTHLRRIRMCCRSLLNPDAIPSFLAAPFSVSRKAFSPEHQSDVSRPDLGENTTSIKDELLELLKLCVYWFLLRFRWK